MKYLNNMPKAVGIHYMGINQPVDKCHKCGYTGEFLATEDGFTCSTMWKSLSSTQMNVIRRVCGYLSQPDARPNFNSGKQKEVIARVKHMQEMLHNELFRY